MSGSVNKVIIVGNCTRAPEIRFSQAGAKIANLSVATNETWKDKATGERKEKVEYHRVVVFSEPLANIVEKYVKKGSKIYLEGSLQTREWEKDGIKRYSTEIVLQGFNSTLTMLDSRTEGGQGGTGDKGRDPDWNEPGANAGGGSAGGDLDDEIPF